MKYFRFRSGYAKYHDLAMLVGFVGRVDPFEPPTKVVVFDEPATAGNVWGLENSEHVFVDVTTFKTADMPRAVFVCLSEEGIVWFQNEEGTVEDIAEAGLWKETSENYGSLSRITQIGEYLYAVGYKGQVYRRVKAGTWEHFDQELLDPEDDKLDIIDLAISSDGIFYAVEANGRIFARREDTVWTPIINPAKEQLRSVTADKDGTVWICGRNGSLLHGNAEQGFVNVSGVDDNAKFLSVALYNDAVWVCIAAKIYTYDGEKITLVETGLTPPLRSANRLQAIDGVLWSFGMDDLVRFDGKVWQRFVCPATEPLV